MGNQALKKEENVVAYTKYDTMENIEEKMDQNQWLLDQYREKNKNIEIKDLYVDINKSAMSDRPAFNRLMKDILDGKIDKVVVLGGLERLSRSSEEVKKICESVEIITVEQTMRVINFNEPIMDSMKEDIVGGLLESLERYYKQENRIRSQRGQELKQKRKEERKRKYEMNQKSKQKEKTI